MPEELPNDDMRFRTSSTASVLPMMQATAAAASTIATASTLLLTAPPPGRRPVAWPKLPASGLHVGAVEQTGMHDALYACHPRGQKGIPGEQALGSLRQHPIGRPQIYWWTRTKTEKHTEGGLDSQEHAGS